MPIFEGTQWRNINIPPPFSSVAGNELRSILGYIDGDYSQQILVTECPLCLGY